MKTATQLREMAEASAEDIGTQAGKIVAHWLEGTERETERTARGGRLSCQVPNPSKNSSHVDDDELAAEITTQATAALGTIAIKKKNADIWSLEWKVTNGP